MSDLKVQTQALGGDLDVTLGNLTLLTGEEAIEQQVRIRLQFFYEEWYRDTRLGIPFFREVLVKNPDLVLLRSIFRQAVVTTPGIASVNELSVTLNKSSRTLNLNFRATMDTGSELVFEPFILEF